MNFALTIKQLANVQKHFLFTCFCLFIFLINSNYVFSQDMPTYEEASEDNNYSTDVTSSFTKTNTNEVKSPTHQPLHQESINTSSLYQLSEQERSEMLKKIKQYKAQGKFGLIKEEMLKLLKNHSLPVKNNNSPSVINKAPTTSDASPNSESDSSTSENSSAVNQGETASKEPLPEEEKVRDDPTKVTTNTLEGFIDESFLSSLKKEVITTINNSPDLLKKIESEPSILKDPSFIRHIEEVYRTQQKQ